MLVETGKKKTREHTRADMAPAPDRSIPLRGRPPIWRRRQIVPNWHEHTSDQKFTGDSEAQVASAHFYLGMNVNSTLATATRQRPGAPLGIDAAQSKTQKDMAGNMQSPATNLRRVQQLVGLGQLHVHLSEDSLQPLLADLLPLADAEDHAHARVEGILELGGQGRVVIKGEMPTSPRRSEWPSKT